MELQEVIGFPGDNAGDPKRTCQGHVDCKDEIATGPKVSSDFQALPC